MLKLNWTGVEDNCATFATIQIPHARSDFIKEKLKTMSGGLEPSRSFASGRNSYFQPRKPPNSSIAAAAVPCPRRPCRRSAPAPPLLRAGDRAGEERGVCGGGGGARRAGAARQRGGEGRGATPITEGRRGDMSANHARGPIESRVRRGG